jgi:effector-binding domain-containing protein
MMSKDFDHGLELLKNISEKRYQTITSYEVKKVIFPARSYAVIQKEVGFDEMKDFFSRSYATIMQAMNQKKMKMIGAPVGLFYTWDEKEMKTNMAAGIPIFGSLQTGEVKTIRLSMATAYMIDYYGAYGGTVYAHIAMDEYLKQKGLRTKMPVIEEYITDPRSEPDNSKWLTRIYYFAE